MTTLFSFPGQGAQRAGLLHALPDDVVVRATLAEAAAVLGRDPLALDSEAALQSTVSVQLALLIAGVAAARSLIDRAGPPDAVAGLSVGAFPAAVIASAMTFADALRCVEQRAQLMVEACPQGFGMTAILGLERDALEPLIAAVHSAASPVYLANLNAPTQLVIAGADAARERVVALALARGAREARPIAINVPSHCALLDDAAALLAQAMRGLVFAPPRLRYFSASAGRELRAPDRIADDLAHNMARPVLWHETTVLASERGVRLFIEMPPGAVLTKLATAAFPEAVALAAGETRADTVAVRMALERDG